MIRNRPLRRIYLVLALVSLCVSVAKLQEQEPDVVRITTNLVQVDLVVTKDGKQVKMDNENAYHINCFECHDAAIKAKPELAQKISGSDPKGCGKCHVAK